MIVIYPLWSGSGGSIAGGGAQATRAEMRRLQQPAAGGEHAGNGGSASIASYAQFPAELDRDWLGRVCHLSGADLAVIRRRTYPVIQRRRSWPSATCGCTPDPPLPLDVDGEIRGHTPARITLAPNALRIMVAPGFPDT